MKTRIIHTKIWKDSWYVGLTKEAKMLWLYLLTNDKINISGIYELTDREIVFDTSIDTSILANTKKALYPKAIFWQGWVRVVNIDRYNTYKNSPLNKTAFNREMGYLPAGAYKGLEIPGNTSIDTSIHTPINQKSEIINKKSETKNQKKEIRESLGFRSARELADKYRLPINGKK